MISYLEAPAALALSLSILMAGAWIVRQRTGNSGWVDTIGTLRSVHGEDTASWMRRWRMPAFVHLVLAKISI